MQNTQQPDNTNVSTDESIKSIGTRGGNDMISGAENWDDIELRIDDERTKIAEADEAVREVGNGRLDPSDEHALSPICTPHCDPNDDLLRWMGDSLRTLETIEKYCSDAEARDDKELTGFFREVRQDEKMKLNKARHYLASRFNGAKPSELSQTHR